MSEFKNLPSGWKVVRLGDVFEKITIKNRPDEPILTIKQGIGTILRENSDRQILFDKKRISTYKFVKNNDFIIHLRSFEGGFEMSNHQGIVSPAYIILRNKILISHLYFKNFFRSHLFIHKILAICVEGIRDGKQLNFDTVKNLKIPFPPLDEQEKIAKILSTWDEAINLTIDLIENKKQLKKALMQNLLTAKIRFPEFQDEWQEDKLAKNVKIQCGYSFESKDFKKQGIPIIRISNISNTSIYMNMTDLVYFDEIQNEKKFLIKKNDLLIAMSGATAGKVSIYNLEQKAYLNQRVGLFRVTSPLLVNYGFLTQFVFSNFFSKQLILLLSTSAQPNISSKDIENLKIKLPNLKEQQKIAEVLTTCDDEINLLNSKLENLKKQKQGLMQKLLSGKVRVRI